MYDPDHFTFGAAIGYPLTQSVITGLLLGLTAGSGGGFFQVSDPGQVGLFVGVLSTSSAWLLCMARWNRAAYPVEALPAGPEAALAPAAPVRIEVAQEQGRHVDLIDLPVPWGKFTALASGLSQGTPFSESVWTGGGNLFSRAEFGRLRDELLRRGLMDWINPEARAQGIRLTRAGAAVMRYCATTDTSPALSRRIA